MSPGRMPFANVNATNPAVRGAFSTYGDKGPEDQVDALRQRCEDSGGIPLAEAEINILTDWGNPNPIIGKERVPFVASGELEKLVVNTLLVLYVP